MKKILALFGLVAVAACNNGGGYDNGYSATPAVDYVEQLNINAAPAPDSFLNQLAMNYRSYAIFNARQSGYQDIGEVFAQKSIAAFSGETPFPESLDDWRITNKDLGFELSRACQDLINMLKNDMSDYCPIEAAEAQAKYDCWLTASASGQNATAEECRIRFVRAMDAMRRGGVNGCGRAQMPMAVATIPTQQAPGAVPEVVYYPETAAMMPAQMRAREGLVIINNVNVPNHLINPEPVQPMVFNQNIYGGDKSVTKSKNVTNGGSSEIADEMLDAEIIKEESLPANDFVSRQEFVEMMLIMREEIRAINARLDDVANTERTMLKVQQIPLEPKQHIMEEIFEVHFDFDKSKIKPEYEEVIRQLVRAAQENRNLKISVVGHTDTMGSADYNYALGGRRAESVRKMLIKYGIPSDQIVTVSSGKHDLKVPTGDQVANAENRRVRVVKEQRYIEQPTRPYVNAIIEGEFEAVETMQ
jgi:outer membrane protein OmpA-like peptidoglycan-associated protein